MPHSRMEPVVQSQQTLPLRSVTGDFIEIQFVPQSPEFG